jgi:methylthioribose-1-phosphate isomerase
MSTGTPRTASFRTIEWDSGVVRLLDQTRLPRETVYVDCRTPGEVADAILTMQIRGAPAIGCAAAFGLALCASQSASVTAAELLSELQACSDMLARTRPTAVNLFWALERVLAAARSTGGGDASVVAERVIQEAQRILAEDVEANRRMGDLGAELLPGDCRILTHCNAGALATGGYGTALGVVRSAYAQGKVRMVYADETRPLLQGARLTAWELAQDGIPVTLITDNMAGLLMRQRKVDAVVVGADRIARNGDVANKVGTYSVAVLARQHGVPFYVAAPVSTVDLASPTGDDIPIEHRAPAEVTDFGGTPIAPAGIEVYNPAFDVTPAALVTAIITEVGVIHAPSEADIPSFLARHAR